MTIDMHHRLPYIRKAITHDFNVGGHEGTITVGLYPDGRPGEVFLRVHKAGSTVRALLDQLATVISIALQHDVSLRKLLLKLHATRYEPLGWTTNAAIPEVSSISDYVARWMAARFDVDLTPPPPPPREPLPDEETSTLAQEMH